MGIRATAIILLFSVLLVFFVPAGAGPFSAVHGPATALRANRAAQAFYLHLALSARHPVATLIMDLGSAPSPVSSPTVLVEPDGTALLSGLRC